MINLCSTNHFSEGYVTTKDNFKIYYKKLKPENPIKNIVIIPGFGATATQFLGLQHFFYENGFSSIILELRGHGFSEGTKGYVNKYDDYLEDISCILNEVTEKNIPTWICGHSNGGLATTYFGIKNQNKYEGLILISPWYSLTKPLNFLENLLVNLGNFMFPKLSAPMGDRGGLASGCTSNPVWQKILDSDKQIHKYATARANYEVNKTQKFVIENIVEIENKKILMIHCKNDPVTDYQTSVRNFSLLTKINNDDKQFIALEKNIHHPFLELENDNLFNKILNFIKK
jgi:alpha-beta hydrolase superfamily lysophospholipase